jgi:hypothetical protein
MLDVVSEDLVALGREGCYRAPSSDGSDAGP